MARPSLDEIFGQAAPVAPPVAPQTSRPSLDEIFGSPSVEKPAEPSRGRTLLEQGLQGATFNLADEAYNRLGAAGASLVTGEKYGDLLNEAQTTTQQRLAKQLEDRPALSIGANIGGALLTGGASATTKSGTALANSLRSGNLAGRAIKAGALGAATGSAAGFGAGSGFENRLDSAGNSALAGGLVGGAIPIVGSVAGKAIKGVKSEVGSLMPKTAQTVKELRDQASPLYDKFTNSGGIYSGKLTTEIADLADAAKSQGIAGSTKKADEALNDALDFYSGLRGKELSPAELQKLDQSFADDIGRFNKAGEYNFGRILNNLKYEMRDRAFDPAKATGYINQGSAGSVEALKEANRLYAQSYKAADIEKILAKAKGTENPQTSIRTNLKNLLANDKKMKNYTQQERAVLEEAMKRGATGGLVKLLGGRLTSAIAGGMAGSPMGVAGTIAGAVAGKAAGGVAADAAGAIQANRLRGALQTIQNPAGAVNKGGLPAVLSNKSAGQLAAPAGAVIGGQSPTRIEVNPNQPNPYQQELPAVNLPQVRPSLDNVFAEPLAPQSNASPLLGNIKKAESAGNPNAKNPNSSASGLYQFTDSTWRSAVDKWGRSQGIKYSDKANPQAQEVLAKKLTEDNARILKTKGIEPTDGNLYFAHFMGAPAASQAIKLLGKGAVAARSFPAAAKSNPTIFFNNGRPRTVDEVYQLITSKVG